MISSFWHAPIITVIETPKFLPRFEMQPPVPNPAPSPPPSPVPSPAPVPRVVAESEAAAAAANAVPGVAVADAVPGVVPGVAVVDEEDAPDRDPDRVLVVGAGDLYLPTTPGTGTKTLPMAKRSTLATSIIGFV